MANPDVRLALAYMATLDLFGFPRDAVKVSADFMMEDRPVLPEPHGYLCVVLALANQTDPPFDFVIVAGIVDRIWWATSGCHDAMTAWNQLNQQERREHRKREVPYPQAVKLATALILKGIAPPFVTADGRVPDWN